MDCVDAESSAISYLRMGSAGPPVLVACNFTPVARADYRIGVPRAGRWRECLNSDAAAYGGSGQGNLGGVTAESVAAHGHAQSLRIRLPPLAAILLMPE